VLIFEWVKGRGGGVRVSGIEKDYWHYNMAWYYSFVLLRLVWRSNGVGSGSIVGRTEEMSI